MVGILVTAPTAVRAGAAASGGSTLVVSTGPNTLLVTSDEPMSDAALDPAAYHVARTDDPSATLLVLRASFVGVDQRVVELTTATQEATAYSLTPVGVGTAGRLGGTDKPGPNASTEGAAEVTTGAVGFNGTAGRVGPAAAAADTTATPGVGAASLSSTSLIVAFSEPMAATTAARENFVITQRTSTRRPGRYR